MKGMYQVLGHAQEVLAAKWLVKTYSNIINVFISEPFDELDSKGIDLVALTTDGKKIPIQVKQSQYQAARFASHPTYDGSIKILVCDENGNRFYKKEV